MSEKKATRAAYGEALLELAAENDKVVVLDADLSHATMTLKFSQTYPDRFFNCGIAECNMIDIAAGMSTMGYIPFASTFAIFGTGRAYEMVRNSVAYPHFNVKLAMTHAGITVGEDGGSHQTFEDMALMRVIPGMTVICPCDANEAKRAVKAAAAMDGPVYLRLARAASHVFEEEMPFEIGKANVLRDGTDGVIFAIGLMVKPALDAAAALAEEGKNVAVVNVHTLKPLDTETVLAYAQNYPDGLSGGRIANVIGAPLVLVVEGKCTAAKNYVSGHGVRNCIVLGGSTLITEKALRSI